MDQEGCNIHTIAKTTETITFSFATSIQKLQKASKTITFPRSTLPSKVALPLIQIQPSSWWQKILRILSHEDKAHRHCKVYDDPHCAFR